MSKSEGNHRSHSDHTIYNTDTRRLHAVHRDLLLELRGKPAEESADIEITLLDAAIVEPATASEFDNAANHPIGNSYEIAPPDEPHVLIRPHSPRHRVASAMLAAAISLHPELSVHRHSNSGAGPYVTCGVHTVSIAFIGVAGQRFSYDQVSYVVPKTGSIELIADPHVKTFEVNHRVLPLIGTQDQFAALTVRLPDPRHEPVQP